MTQDRDQRPHEWRPPNWSRELVWSALVALHEWAVAQGRGELALATRALLLAIRRRGRN